MVSFKVEINVMGMWVPATHKYFKDEERAQDYRERLMRNNPNIKKSNIRIRCVGKLDKPTSFFMGFEFALLTIGFINTLMFAVEFIK